MAQRGMQLNNGNNEIEMVQEHQYLMLHAMIVAKSTHRKTCVDALSSEILFSKA
jgi:hypothetical protein